MCTLRPPSVRLRRRAAAVAVAGIGLPLFALLLAGCRPLREPAARFEPRARARGLALARFADVLPLPDAELDLGVAALLFPDREAADPDFAAERRRLDELAARVRRSCGARATPSRLARALNAVLLGAEPERAFAPDDPEGFRLTRVLETGRGSCLGLVLLYLAVGERLGAPLAAAAAPGHVFVRYTDGTFHLNVETTRAGRRRSDAHYRRWRRVPSDPAARRLYLRPLGAREVLALLAANEAGRLVRLAQPEAALEQAELALRLCLPPELAAGALPATEALPDSPAVAVALTNRGLAEERLGRPAEARASFAAAVARDPGAAAARGNLARLVLDDPAADCAAREQALALALAAAALEPETADFWAVAARAAEALGQAQPAAEYRERAAAAKPVPD